MIHLQFVKKLHSVSQCTETVLPIQEILNWWPAGQIRSSLLTADQHVMQQEEQPQCLTKTCRGQASHLKLLSEVTLTTVFKYF